MSGKVGMKSDLSRELPRRYSPQLLEGVDCRRREARRFNERLTGLIVECGGPENLSPLDLETLARLVHLGRRIGKQETAELFGQPVDTASLNDSLRSWLGLLRQVEAIKARRKVGGTDLARALQQAMEAEAEEDAI